MSVKTTEAGELLHCVCLRFVIPYGNSQASIFASVARVCERSVKNCLGCESEKCLVLSRVNRVLKSIAEEFTVEELSVSKETCKVEMNSGISIHGDFNVGLQQAVFSVLGIMNDLQRGAEQFSATAEIINPKPEPEEAEQAIAC